MKITKIFLALLAVIILVSCTRDRNLEKKYEIDSTQELSSSYTSEEKELNVNLVNNETSYDKLITKEIDIHYVAEKYFINVLAYSDIYDIENDIGIECLRRNEGGTYYSVHKAKQGGLLYIFYPDYWEEHQMWPVREWFYVQKDLSYSDFDGIKEGAVFEDVKMIDPAVQIFINIYNSNPEYWNNYSLGFRTHHYLSDGILYLNYKYSDGKFKVSNKKFVQNFEMELYFETTYYYDGSILPIDRIE